MFLAEKERRTKGLLGRERAMAERSSIVKTLILVTVLLSVLNYSAEEEEARFMMKKSFKFGNFSNKTDLPGKVSFNPLRQVVATSGLYVGVVLFWVGFAYVSLKYVKIFLSSIDDFGEYDIMARPRIRSGIHITKHY